MAGGVPLAAEAACSSLSSSQRGLTFASYWFSDKIVLKMYHAREMNESAAPELYGMVRRLATQAGLPMPKVYLIPGEQLNAFATGRNLEHSAVAVTEGILRILNREELAGVIGHELAHIRNRDILIGTVAATIAGAISMISYDGAVGDDLWRRPQRR